MPIRIPRPIPVEIVETKQEYKSSKNALYKDLRDIGFFRLDGEENFLRVRKCLPTGIAALDLICARDQDGVYGLPFGKQIEISGKPDSGKTSLLLHIASQAQRIGHTVCWIETEDTLSEARAAVFGTDIEKFMLATPDYLEQALSMIKKIVLLVPKYDSREYTPNKGMVIIWDSVAATPTKNEFTPKKGKEGEAEFSTSNVVAEFARIMSQYERKIKKRIAKRDVLIIYCNQLKDKIGISFGDKTQTYGGHALRFHCAIRMKSNYTGKLKSTGGDNKGQTIGITMKLENKKNKCLMPWGILEGIEYDFKRGFNIAQGLLYALEAKGFAKKKGSNYTLEALTDMVEDKKSKKKKMKKREFTVKTFAKFLEENPNAASMLMSSINVS